MFASLLLIASAGAAAPASPVLHGNRLQAGTTCYVIERDGSAIGETFQSIQTAHVGDVPAWRIVVHQRVSGGKFDLRDEFLVRRSDLRPFSLHSTRGAPAAAGWQQVDVNYGPAGISGTRTDAKGARPIAVSTDRTVWDGNLWGLTFAALPLRNGGQFQVPVWQYDKGFGTLRAKVVGVERVETPGDRIEAWVVEAGDDPKQLVRYLISKGTRHELGYGAGGMRQRLGGSCKGID